MADRQDYSIWRGWMMIIQIAILSVLSLSLLRGFLWDYKISQVLEQFNETKKMIGKR